MCCVVLRTKRVVAGLEDLLFYTITQGEEKISVARFLAVSSTNKVTLLMTTIQYVCEMCSEFTHKEKDI